MGQPDDFLLVSSFFPSRFWKAEFGGHPHDSGFSVLKCTCLGACNLPSAA